MNLAALIILSSLSTSFAEIINFTNDDPDCINFDPSAFWNNISARISLVYDKLSVKPLADRVVQANVLEEYKHYKSGKNQGKVMESKRIDINMKALVSSAALQSVQLSTGLTKLKQLVENSEMWTSLKNSMNSTDVAVVDFSASQERITSSISAFRSNVPHVAISALMLILTSCLVFAHTACRIRRKRKVKV